MFINKLMVTLLSKHSMTLDESPLNYFLKIQILFKSAFSHFARLSNRWQHKTFN